MSSFQPSLVNNNNNEVNVTNVRISFVQLGVLFLQLGLFLLQSKNYTFLLFQMITLKLTEEEDCFVFCFTMVAGVFRLEVDHAHDALQALELVLVVALLLGERVLALEQLLHSAHSATAQKHTHYRLIFHCKCFELWMC